MCHGELDSVRIGPAVVFRDDRQTGRRVRQRAGVRRTPEHVRDHVTAAAGEDADPVLARGTAWVNRPPALPERLDVGGHLAAHAPVAVLELTDGELVEPAHWDEDVQHLRRADRWRVLVPAINTPTYVAEGDGVEVQLGVVVTDPERRRLLHLEVVRLAMRDGDRRTGRHRHRHRRGGARFKGAVTTAGEGYQEGKARTDPLQSPHVRHSRPVTTRGSPRESDVTMPPSVSSSTDETPAAALGPSLRRAGRWPGGETRRPAPGRTLASGRGTPADSAPLAPTRGALGPWMPAPSRGAASAHRPRPGRSRGGQP